VHPGAIVGVDLILWLGLIVTGLFTVAAIYIFNYSSDYSGHYILANNGTWVYKFTYVANSNGGYRYNTTSGTYSYHTNPLNASSVHRNCEPYFNSCVKQDELVNRLWREKNRLEGLEITSAATQWLGVLLHFILFVWACVDTKRRNERKKDRKAGEVAERVLRDLQGWGLIPVHDAALAGRVGGGQPGPTVGEPEMRQVRPQVQPQPSERLAGPSNGDPDMISAAPRRQT
jgi:hypothetical protein